LFRSTRIPKYSWLEIECARTRDFQNRKESYKIRTDSNNYGIRSIDLSLVPKKGRPAPWAERSKYVKPVLSPSLEHLWGKFEEDKTSLGLIKVDQLLDFHYDKPLNKMEEAIEQERSSHIQKTLFGDNRSLLERIPHNFYYKFRCSPDCSRIHDISFEDWEVFESFRQWREYYPDKDVLWQKLRQKYLEEFRNRDLYFFVGTHSRWPVWMIVGAYYPPK